MQTTVENSVSRKRKHRPDRLEYLDQLAVEFQTTNSKGAREQVLANLANFAFDPFNYKYFRQLNILDLFLDTLSSREENLVKFSIGGLCNLCLDPINKQYIFKNGLKRIINLLGHINEDVLLSTVTTLIFLITPESKQEITKPDVIKAIHKYLKNKNLRLSNLAKIFLEDYCSVDQIEKASAEDELIEIPLPDPET